METLLLIGGVVLVFAAGWSMARVLAPDVQPPLPTPVDRGSSDSVYVNVLERHPTGVVVASATGDVEYANAAASADDGTHVGVLVDEAVARHLAVSLDGASSSETLELYGPPARVVVVSSEPLPAGRAVAFIDDISDRRRADQARTDFVANVSHELRTPVGALMVLAETLDGEEDPEVIARIVARMQGEGARAARTIDDLLQLSQIEAGAERDLRPVRLSDVINEAVHRAAELAAANDIRLSTLDTAGSGGPIAGAAVVNGDRRQLASAVGNLVENAVKYSDPGQAVTVRLRSDGGFGEISVVDAGVGIPHSDLDRVFERFYRVDRARSRETGGMGLGLSIVRHVANNHDGTVSVESIEGEGSTFLLRLPLVEETDDATAIDDADVNTPNDAHEGVA